MSIPAVLGAVVLKLKDFSVVPLQTNDVIAYIIGTIIAGLVGYISIKTMLVIVRGKKFKYFSYYCFIIGVIAIGWNFIK
jgi:undecaprenyl-diphosphatase